VSGRSFPPVSGKNRDVEAATATRPPRRRRRRHGSAAVAALLYAGFAVAAIVLVSRSLDVGAPAIADGDEPAADGSATVGGGPDQLALQSIGARAQRSTVGVGRETGFVAWESNGLTLVMTSRPAGGWRTGRDRIVRVRYGSELFDGTLARSDAATRLGLVRVLDAGIAEALWPAATAATVGPGDLVVLVGRSSSRTVEVERVGRNRLYFAGTGLGAFVGAPVLDGTGRVVGVVDAGGGATPIGRACGAIRRC
jgi:hypothetical protein